MHINEIAETQPKRVFIWNAITKIVADVFPFHVFMFVFSNLVPLDLLIHACVQLSRFVATLRRQRKAKALCLFHVCKAMNEAACFQLSPINHL